jgi:hypothetical protein
VAHDCRDNVLRLEARKLNLRQVRLSFGLEPLSFRIGPNHQAHQSGALVSRQQIDRVTQLV